MNDFTDINFKKFIFSSGKEEWKELPHIAYQPNTILGKTYEGSTVYRGRFGHRQVAVKEVDTASFNLMEQEIELIISWEGHPNVIKYFAKEKCGRFYYLALDLCQGNMREYMLSEKVFYGEPLEPMALLQQITLGLHYLHENKYIHGGLHPGNILISHPNDFNKVKAVITDFPISNSDTSGKSLTSPEKSLFLSLDASELPEYTEAGDVFSLGCLHYYVITKGCQMFRSHQDPIHRQTETEMLEGENTFIKDFIKRMVHKEPKARPTCVEIFQSPLYWSSAQTLQYLETAADWLVSGILHNNILRQMEDGRDIIFQDNWKCVLTPGLQMLLSGEFKHGQKYDYKSVVDLLRMIRNKSRHYNDVPNNLKAEFTSHPEGYIKYFTSRFPQLVLHVFNRFQEFTENANLVLRNHKSCECRQQKNARDQTYCKMPQTKERESEKHDVKGTNNYEKYAEGNGMVFTTDPENDSGDHEDEKEVPNIHELIKQFEPTETFKFVGNRSKDQSRIPHHFPQPDRDLSLFCPDSVNATESYLGDEGHGNSNMDINFPLHPKYTHIQMSDNDNIFLAYSSTADANETRNENVWWQSNMLNVTPIYSDKLYNGDDRRFVIEEDAAFQKYANEHKHNQNVSKRFSVDKHPENKPKKMEDDIIENYSASLYLPVSDANEDSYLSGSNDNFSFSDVNEDAPVPDVNEGAPVPDVNEDEPVPDVLEDAPVPDVLEDAPVPDVNEGAPVPDVNEDEPVSDVLVDAPVPDVGEDPPVPDVNEDAPVPDVNEDAPVPDVNEGAPVPDVNEDPLVPYTFQDEPGAGLSQYVYAPVPGVPRHVGLPVKDIDDDASDQGFPSVHAVSYRRSRENQFFHNDIGSPRMPQVGSKLNGSFKDAEKEVCHLCEKTAYVVESCNINGQTIHKTCFRCSQCKLLLSIGQYHSVDGMYYCTPHFKKLIIAKDYK